MPDEAAAPPPPVRVLLLDDNADDVALLQAALRRCGVPMRFEFVGDEANFRAALERQLPDIVLADYALKGYTGLDALRELRRRGLTLPFILVSGSLTDEVAADCCDLGAADYILKDRLSRLPRAVQRALAEHRLRTEHARAQADLQRSYREYQALFQGSPDPMVVFDLPTLQFLAVNAAATRLYGYTAEEFLRLRLTELAPPEGAADMVKHINESDSSIAPESGAVPHRRKDGAPLWVELHSTATTFDGRPARLLLVRDVTERRHLEEQLRHAHKMEAIGRLAGGIAHDFNNLLMVMRGFAELLHVNMPAGPQRRQAEKIVAAADRAGRLVGQLLAFGRKQVLSPRTLDLNECLAEIGKLLPRVLGEHIEIGIRPGADLQPVKLDPLQIEQVLMNLGINARDAMPEGGKLLLETRNVVVDAAFCRRHLEAVPGPYVLLVVSDTGCGMDAETQQHVFEPFFTTKDTGFGTGLGLATVYGIVRQSGGFIGLYSEPGCGTTFKLYFPTVAGPVEPLARPACCETGAPGGDETVLLVEDEQGVREAMTEFLRLRGYSVLEAPNGREALEVARRFRGRIHLVVTDVVMPGMGGRELAKQLLAERPEMRVIFISGYSGTAMTEQLALAPDTAFLEKPFTWDALSRKVREVLEPAPGPGVAPGGAERAVLQ